MPHSQYIPARDLCGVFLADALFEEELDDDPKSAPKRGMLDMPDRKGIGRRATRRSVVGALALVNVDSV